MRARWSGHRLLVEAFVEAEGLTTLHEGEHLTDAINQKLRHSVRSVESTTVQFGIPEDQEATRTRSVAPA